MSSKQSSATERRDLVAALYEEERHGAQRAVLFHAEVAARAGINITDVNCLATLDKEGPMTAGQLAQRMGLSRGGAITALLDRLERTGYLHRRRDTEDRRKVIVELLPNGRYKTLQRALDAFAGDYAELLEEYDRDQLALLLDFSRRTNEILQRHTAELGQ